MKNQAEIYQALLDGEVIKDLRGNEVWLNNDGETSFPCDFIDPEYWSIKPKLKQLLKSN